MLTRWLLRCALGYRNKDDSGGGIWYMNPDGSSKVKVGETKVGAESTGILDVSEFLNYPPSYAMITTNQGSPSSMTLLLNPDLRAFVADHDADVPASPQVSPTTINVTPPVPASPKTEPPTATPIQPDTIIPEYDGPEEDGNTVDCPVSDEDGRFQVFQAEDATLYSADIKTKADNFCGIGYVDFRGVAEGSFFISSQSGRTGAPGRNPVFAKKDGIVQRQPLQGVSVSRTDGGSSVSGRTPIVDKKDGIIQKHEPDGKYRAASRQGSVPTGVIGIAFENIEISYPGIYRVAVRYSNGGGIRPGIFLVDEEDADDDFDFVPTLGWSA